jgi:hypothetical protein
MQHVVVFCQIVSPQRLWASSILVIRVAYGADNVRNLKVVMGICVLPNSTFSFLTQ